MSACQDDMPPVGTPVSVKVGGVPTPATYHGWSEKYSMPLVQVNGKVLPRAFTLSATPSVATPTVAAPKRRSKTGLPDDTDEAEWPGTYAIVRNGWIRCFSNGVLKSKTRDRDFKPVDSLTP